MKNSLEMNIRNEPKMNHGNELEMNPKNELEMNDHVEMNKVIQKYQKNAEKAVLERVYTGRQNFGYC